MRGAWVGALVIFGAAGALHCAREAPDEHDSTSWAYVHEPTPDERAMLERLNGHRNARGLAPLSFDAALIRAAHAHALDLGRSDYFAHEDRIGRRPLDRARAAGYRGALVAENLAAGFRSAEETMGQWAASPAHAANVEDVRLRAVGLARVHVPASTFGYYWVALFGDTYDEPVEGDTDTAAGSLSGDPEEAGPTSNESVRDAKLVAGGHAHADVHGTTTEPGRWYKVPMRAGERYAFEVTAPADAQLLAFRHAERDGAGTLLRIPSPEWTRVANVAHADGTYFVVVFSPSSRVQPFRLRVERRG
jgi:uncharacterized protein YkwD